jgi:hypothetical protein
LFYYLLHWHYLLGALYIHTIGYCDLASGFLTRLVLSRYVFTSSLSTYSRANSLEEVFTLNEEEHFLKNFEQLDNEREAAVEKLKASMLPTEGHMSAGMTETL